MNSSKVEYKLTWFQRFAINVVKCGPIPRHIAFIMDGNRRYARERGLETKLGHYQGYEKLTETRFWCKQLGISEITVYAFSIDNFKRHTDEVDDLLDLAKTRFQEMLDRMNELVDEGACVRVVGNLNLLPTDVKKLAAEVMITTKDNKGTFLNIAFPYTSRHEIANAIKAVAKGVREGSLKITDVDEELLSRCMLTNQSPEPDLLLRTSGETRLSDFLLWQTRSTRIFFEKCLWPDLDFWTFLKTIFFYQRCCGKNQMDNESAPWSEEETARREAFLQNLNDTRWKLLHEYLNDEKDSSNI